MKTTEQQMYTLKQDANQKLIVELSQIQFENHLRSYFRWRKDVNVKRFNKLGTHEHDKFIKYLHNLGYNK